MDKIIFSSECLSKCNNGKQIFFGHFYYTQTEKMRFICFLFIFIFTIGVFGQQIKPKQLRHEILTTQPSNVDKPSATSKKSKLFFQPLAPTVKPLEKQGVSLIYLQNSETLSFDKIVNPDVQVLKGNVQFRHDNALLYCDSAYFYENKNSLDAFGNVRIIHGDTLFVYGDLLYYDGNTKLARLRKNVRMINRKTTLTTDSLNYDRVANLSYYYTGGKIVDELNTLTSLWGQYSPASNQAIFKSQVKLNNKNFTLVSDTLHYNTKSRIANIVG
jgi:lipopolysaccharide assembly outer membrane protein LptD (OstA)